MNIINNVLYDNITLKINKYNIWIYILLCSIIIISILVSTARVIINAEGPANLYLLGQQECTWGPSYWCENIKCVQ